MSEACCPICHRYRDADKMDASGRRCADREGCLKAAARSPGVKVPKRVLRAQFKDDVIR